MICPMQWTLTTSILALASALHLSGCGATRLEDSEWQRLTGEQARSRGEGGDSLRAAAAIPADPLRTEASARYIIERGRSGEATDTWAVTISAPDEAGAQRTGHFTVRMSGKTDDGTSFDRTAVTKAYLGSISVSKNGGDPEVTDSILPVGITRLGFFDSCELWAGLETEQVAATASERLSFVETHMDYFFALFALVKVADENKAVRKLLLNVIQFPSWWSLLTLSVDFEPKIDLTLAEAVDTAFGPGYRIPLELRINDDPAL